MSTTIDTSGLNPFANFEEEDDYKKKEGFESPLSPSVYDAAPDPVLEQFLEPVLGEENSKALQYKANSMGVSRLTALRQVMGLAFIDGNFQIAKLDSKGELAPIPQDSKRTGNDNNPKDKSNIQIRALIRKSNYGFLNAAAQQVGMSNLAALRSGVASMLNTKKAMELIHDSELAMKALESKF